MSYPIPRISLILNNTLVLLIFYSFVGLASPSRFLILVKGLWHNDTIIPWFSEAIDWNKWDFHLVVPSEEILNRGTVSLIALLAVHLRNQFVKISSCAKICCQSKSFRQLRNPTFLTGHVEMVSHKEKRLYCWWKLVPKKVLSTVRRRRRTVLFSIQRAWCIFPESFSPQKRQKNCWKIYRAIRLVEWIRREPISRLAMNERARKEGVFGRSNV